MVRDQCEPGLAAVNGEGFTRAANPLTKRATG
jgi:hypothetical protein